MSESLQILKDNNLSKTEIRTKILDLFIQSNNALSLSDIESSFEKIDRITLYRTLKTFEGKGIIHKALDGTNHPKYAMCVDQCNEHFHQDNHAHFHCTTCEKTICLENIPTPTVPNLPNGFHITETNLIISGTCSSCN